MEDSLKHQILEW